MPYTVHTIQITHDNADQIVDTALTQAWTLDLQDNLEYYEAFEGFKAYVSYFTVDETGRILNHNDVPFFDDTYKTMDHIDVKDLLALIQK